MNPASSHDFLHRSQLYLQHACAAASQWYAQDGTWIATSLPPATRERYWLCCALFTLGKNDLANAIIRQSIVDNSAEYGCPTTYNIFHTNIATVLLKAYAPQIELDVRNMLRRLIHEGFSFFPGNRFADYQFHGYNDNFPAKATMGLILGGEMLEHAPAIEHGLWNLRQFHAQLRRGGVNSEYNSLTYSPLTIHALAEIAQEAQHPEARHLALALEERLWIDMAARFHPGMGVVAGPHSRAYTIDTLAHLSCASALLWLILGEAAHPSPMELFNPPRDLVLHHEGDVPFNVAQMCWFATGHYHVPETAHRLLQEKNYPFQATALAEVGDWGPDFPARTIQVETRLERDFAVGTSSTPYGNGWQSAPYMVTYKQRADVLSFRDLGTVYSKFLINNQEPGKISASAIPSSEQCDLVSHGNAFTCRSENTVLLLSHPHLSLGGDANDHSQKPTPLSCLRETILFPCHGGEADEIRVGNSRRSTWSGDVPHGEWIACRRGRLLIAIRPLVHSSVMGTPCIRLEKQNRYDVLSCTFYEGESRSFSRAQLRHVYGGFVAEHASVDDYQSLDEFVEELENAEFTDYFWTTRKVRYRRPIGLHRPELEMELSWSPGAQPPRFCQINGQSIAPTLLKIDGVDSTLLPILREPRQTIAPYFPWKQLDVSDFLAKFVGTPGTEVSIGDTGRPTGLPRNTFVSPLIFPSRR